MKKIPKRTVYLVVGIVGIALSFAGLSYAIFQSVFYNTSNQVVTTGSLVINLGGCTGPNQTLTTDLMPLSPTDGMLLPGCNITVENTGTLPAYYRVKLYNNPSPAIIGDLSEYLEHSNLYISFDSGTPVLVSDLDKENPSIVIENDIIYILTTDVVAPLDTNTHNIKIWLIEEADESVIEDKINFIIEVEAIVDETEPVSNVILAGNGGSSVIEAKGNPSFYKAAVSQEYYDLQSPQTYYVVENGMWAMEDEYGMSYYFRGGYDVVNNNLIFAGFQWKIIRINGDGSIRIIYNGTCPGNTVPCNGTGINTTGPATDIGTYAWNTTNRNDAKYVGYMYGGANGVASSTYEEATESIKGVSTSNNAKTQLDSWYATNLLSQGSSITDKIVDNVFCNDRKPSSTTSNVNYTLGYGDLSSTTYYASYLRMNNTNWLPSLLCQNEFGGSVPATNDQFTVSQITYTHPNTGSKTIGNGALTYPVGLITNDEVGLAGAYNTTINGSYYLYSNQAYWVMSPNTFQSSIAYVRYASVNGTVTMSGAYSTYGLRPVINLSPTVKAKGTGSLLDPYIVQ